MVNTENHKIPSVKQGMLLSGDGIFFTLQGEGPSIGRSAVFLRLHLCNLACTFKDGSICDAWYTWKKDTLEYQTEAMFMSYPDIVHQITKHPTTLLVITGGEPLIHSEHILHLIKLLPSYWEVEIETNGTLRPLSSFKTYGNRVAFNCSPKLSNSGNSLARSINPSVIACLKTEYRSIFKFVASSLEDLEEIAEFVKTHSIHKTKVFIMPEGVDARVLKNRMKKFAEYIKEQNWRLTPRLHIMIWGNQRKT